MVLAFVGAAPLVRIDWTPKAEGATGLAALVSTYAEQQVYISEGVTHCRVNLAYTVSRAELGQLALEVPADYKVVNVFDANVRQWSVEQAAEAEPSTVKRVTEKNIIKPQKITVQLFEPAKKSQHLTVELEKYAAREKSSRSTTVFVPVVKALNVARQQGIVVVQVAAGLAPRPRKPPACCSSMPANCPNRCGDRHGPSPIATRQSHTISRWQSKPFSRA